MQINISKVNKTLTLKSNIFLAGITQLIAFIIIHKSKLNIGHLSIKTMVA
ncbi:hypothetical protein F3D3_4760 [Fusibacter sp. 3D3]|nr:hypothetical protein F3D3_3827 [Fusibacter sp. 3D3]GAU80084.1 hypothetical protein F3D3_4750 [Fusibacter sp. 3D3]GAU80094.1 hypothetical protein F3D3_4760 [Fusibacter sp. 3D3]